MRDFKFRAWDDKNKEWLLGYNYKNLGGFSMFGEMMLMDEWNAVVHAHNRGDVEIKLMQYTGLKDKNGVEIYEADILRWSFESEGANEELERHEGSGFIEWSERRANYIVSNTKSGALKKLHHIAGLSEVIGNIYETPELLEDK